MKTAPENAEGVFAKPKMLFQTIVESMTQAEKDITNLLKVLARAIRELRPPNDFDTEDADANPDYPVTADVDNLDVRR